MRQAMKETREKDRKKRRRIKGVFMGKGKMGQICRLLGVLSLSFLCLYKYNHPPKSVAKENTENAEQNRYAEDERLELAAHETYDQNPVELYLSDRSRYMMSYSEEEMTRLKHAYFDERSRLRYFLGYGSESLENSYCEENIYEWDDDKHTCRYIYYKASRRPYETDYYVANRYMFEVSNSKFDEDDRLIAQLSYRRDVGSDPYGYSDELFFSRGYQADYEEEKLMEELQYNDYWGSNEFGAWVYRVYQYNEQGECILKVETTEEEIALYYYQYNEKTGKVDEYIYQIKEDWEMTCDDKSIIYFRPQWGKPAVKKVSADGSIEKEFFYGKVIDMGQQHFLMPQDVEDTLDDHKHVVKPGDCLWRIAEQYYGKGEYYDLLYGVNRGAVGWDENLILPGTCLYIPETGNAQDRSTQPIAQKGISVK